MRKKIYCLEREKKSFDKIPINEIQEMVGWITYLPTKGLLLPTGIEHDINLLNEGEGYITKNEDNANIISSLEEIKALLIKLLEKRR